MLGGLFVVIKKIGLRKFTSLLLSLIIFKFKLLNTPFPQMIKTVKIHHFHHSGEKNLDCKHS